MSYAQVPIYQGNSFNQGFQSANRMFGSRNTQNILTGTIQEVGNNKIAIAGQVFEGLSVIPISVQAGDSILIKGLMDMGNKYTCSTAKVFDVTAFEEFTIMCS